MQNGTVTLENSLAVVYKINMQLATHNQGIPLLAIYPRGMKIYVHIKTYQRMFTAALFIIVKYTKKLKCLPTSKWINDLWYIHTMEYSSIIKMNHLLLYATT